MGLERYGNILLGGLIAEVSPELFKGILIELLSKTTVEEASDWITKDYVLLDKIEPKYLARIKKFVPRFGDTSWFTADWVIEALRKDVPALASLFIGWKKGYNWLGRQVEIIQREIALSRS